MTVKIVEDKPQQVQCTGCQRTLEYTSEDIKYQVIERDFGDAWYLCIFCPLCRTETKVK